MALVNPNIAMGVKPFELNYQPRNALTEYAQVLQLKNALTETQREEGITNYLKNADLSTPEGRAGLRQFGKTGLAYEKLLADQEMNALKRKELEGKVRDQQMAALGTGLTSVMSDPSDANLTAAFDRLDATGVDTKALRQQFSGMPDLSARKASIMQYVSSNPEGRQALAFVQPQPEKFDLNGKIVVFDKNPNSPTYMQQIKEFEKGMSPYEAARLQNMKDRLAAESATGVLTPDTLDFAAQMYTQSGQLPPLGIGKGAAQIKAQIMNRAAQIAMGGEQTPAPGAANALTTAPAPGAAPAAPKISAAEAAGNVIGSKQNVAAQSAALKSFNTGVEGRAVRSFNTAIDHLDTMDKLATALANNDIRAFNSVGNAFASATGNPAPTNFDAAKAIVGGEVAKALTGSNMALKDREEVRDTLARANSPEQLRGVIRTMQHLMGGQLKSLDLQYTSSTGRKDFSNKLTPRSKEVIKSLAGETAPGAAPAAGGIKFLGFE